MKKGILYKNPKYLTPTFCMHQCCADIEDIFLPGCRLGLIHVVIPRQSQSAQVKLVAVLILDAAVANFEWSAHGRGVPLKHVSTGGAFVDELGPSRPRCGLVAQEGDDCGAVVFLMAIPLAVSVGECRHTILVH